MQSQFYKEYDINGLIHYIRTIPNEFLDLIEDAEAGKLLSSPGHQLVLEYLDDQNNTVTQTFYAISRPSSPTTHEIDIFSEQAYLGAGSGGACYEVALSIRRDENTIVIEVPSLETQVPEPLKFVDDYSNQEFTLLTVITPERWAAKLLYKQESAKAEHTALSKLHDEGKRKHLNVKPGWGKFKSNGGDYQAHIVVEAGAMNLHTLLQRNKAGEYKQDDVFYLTAEKRVQLMQDLASLMDDAEQIGIVHADINPTNILVKTTGINNDTLTLNLIDFHLTTINSSDDDEVNENEGIYGTPGNMAPELLHGEKLVSHESDAYAFWMTCLQLFCVSDKGCEKLDEYFDHCKNVGLSGYVALPEITADMFDIGNADANTVLAAIIKSSLHIKAENRLARASGVAEIKALFQPEKAEVAEEVNNHLVQEPVAIQDNNEAIERSEALIPAPKLQPADAVAMVNTLFQPAEGIKDQHFNLSNFLLPISTTDITFKKNFNYRFEAITQLAKIIESLYQHGFIINNVSTGDFKVVLYHNNQIQVKFISSGKLIKHQDIKDACPLEKSLDMLGLLLTTQFPDEISISSKAPRIIIKKADTSNDDAILMLAFLLANILNLPCDVQLIDRKETIIQDETTIATFSKGNFSKVVRSCYKSWIDTADPENVVLEKYIQDKSGSLLKFLNNQKKDFIRIDDINGKQYFFLKRYSNKYGKHPGEPILEVFNNENDCSYSSSTIVNESVGMVVKAGDAAVKVMFKQKPEDQKRVIKLADSVKFAKKEYKFQLLAGKPLHIKPPIDISFKDSPELTAVVMRKAGKYNVQELLDKNNKQIFCKQSPYYFTMEACIKLSIRILEAIQQQVHDKKLVHRDIKPQNIMITALPGGDFKVIIIDYELAKRQSKNDLLYQRGTLAYRSPEVKANLGSTTKSDIYAAGIVVATLLHPFKPKFEVGVFDNIELMQHPDPNSRPELKGMIQLLQIQLNNLQDPQNQPRINIL